MMMAFTLQRIEAEADITKALNAYPNERAFKRFTLEFASIFKNTKWDAESEADEEKGIEMD